MSTDLYLLLDCAADPQHHHNLQFHAQRLHQPHASLFERQPEAAHASAAPWLMQLPAQSLDLPLRMWMQLLQHSYFGATVLQAPGGFSALLHHLQGCLDLRCNDGAAALMRFADPRAFVRYCAVLSPPQQRQLLGPVQVWQIEYAGQTAHLRRDDLPQQAAAAPPAPIQLSPQQTALLNLPDAERFLPRLLAEMSREYPTLDAKAERVQHSWQHAQHTLGITHLPTLVAWVKADAGWVPGLRDSTLCRAWFANSATPNLLAADLLQLLNSMLGKGVE